MSSTTVRPESQPRKFTIGIGAASGAGKSTISRLISPVLQNAIKLASKEVDPDTFLDRAATSVRIVVQDDYYIPPTEQKWPLVQFPNPDSSAVETQPTITVPDRECIEAINFVKIHEEALRTGTTEWNDTLSQTDPGLSIYTRAATSILREALVRAYLYRWDAGVADGPFFKIRPDDRRPTLNCSFTIVEGHLVHAQATEARASKQPDCPEYSKLVAKLRQSQDELKHLFDVGLFLPVAEETAFQRRFQRPEYRDRSEANPRGRIPEHFWTYESYFEHTWASYVDLHGHLLSGTNPEHVCVRPDNVDSIGDTLVWSAKIIAQAILSKEFFG